MKKSEMGGMPPNPEEMAENQSVTENLDTETEESFPMLTDMDKLLQEKGEMTTDEMNEAQKKREEKIHNERKNMPPGKVKDIIDLMDRSGEEGEQNILEEEVFSITDKDEKIQLMKDLFPLVSTWNQKMLIREYKKLKPENEE